MDNKQINTSFINPRRLALDAIEKILYKGAYSNIVISATLNKYLLEKKEKALFTKLVMGTVENKLTLEYYLEPYLKKKQKTWVHILLIMSLYQLIYLSIPEASVVFEAVELANNRSQAVGAFVNAILRNFLKNPRRSLENLDELERLAIEFSYPQWLVAYLLKDYDYQSLYQIFKYFSLEKHDAIRVNTLKATKEEVKLLLDQEGYQYQDSNLVKNGLIVEKSLIHHDLFKKGKITVQDIASQMVSEILAPSKNANILDLCSAPGGKVAHLAALMNNSGSIFACDVYKHKLKLMEKTFERLGVTNVKPQLIDARNVYLQVKEASFDYVLADLPCSGLGVMGNKVDLKYNISLSSIDEVMSLQKEILSKTYMLVKKGGFFVISTCTINKAENEELSRWFIKNYPEYEIISETINLPHLTNTDGFYICKLRRR